MKKNTKKKRNRRNSSKYPALHPEYNLKSRTDLIDYDYLDKLSEKDKAWLNSFTEEYVNANFNHDGKRIHPKKYKTKKVQRTGKKKKIDLFKNESERRNNARNRCVLTKAGASGKKVDLDQMDPSELFKILENFKNSESNTNDD